MRSACSVAKCKRGGDHPRQRTGHKLGDIVVDVAEGSGDYTGCLVVAAVNRVVSRQTQILCVTIGLAEESARVKFIVERP